MEKKGILKLEAVKQEILSIPACKNDKELAMDIEAANTIYEIAQCVGID